MPLCLYAFMQVVTAEYRLACSIPLGNASTLPTVPQITAAAEQAAAQCILAMPPGAKGGLPRPVQKTTPLQQLRATSFPASDPITRATHALSGSSAILELMTLRPLSCSPAQLPASQDQCNLPHPPGAQVQLEGEFQAATLAMWDDSVGAIQQALVKDVARSISCRRVSSPCHSADVCCFLSMLLCCAM